MPPQIDEPREFRMLPAFRRCAIYAVVGAIVCSVAMPGVLFPPQRPAGEIVFIVCLICFLLTGAAGLAFLVFRWRLRVDARGISCRRLFSWQLWPWEAFEDGRIRAYLNACVWAEQPWWRRTLVFMVDEDARDFLNDLCREFQPPSPSLPDEIEVRFFSRKRVTFSADGIRYYEGGCEFPYFWTDVQQVRITVAEHGWQGFQRLVLQLTQHEVNLVVSDGRATWKGPDAETVRQFVEQHVPAEHVLIIARRGAPRSLEEADLRIEETELRLQALRKSRFLTAIIFGSLLGAVVLLAREWNVWQLPLGCCYGFVFLLIWRFTKGESVRRLSELQQLQQCRDGFSSGGQSSGP